ncbi:lipoprotein [Streptomyces sp. NPDC008092]|uniref:lipoprotein n=1 Tax=Streptomyces sp. NPDC008092 TaxID=3364808 RepID=UPI0036EC188C
MGTHGGRVALTGLFLALLAGCGAAPRAVEVTESGHASGAAAQRGGSVGAAGSACELPVVFDIAKGWKAEAVDGLAAVASAGTDSDITEEVVDGLLRQGPVTMVCEIDAKPAGNIGYLRAWTGRPGSGDARAVLQAFVAAEDNTGGAAYRTFTAGGLSGVRVDYRYTSKLLAETKKESALAVVTPKGPVVLHLGGLDSAEHDEMLPAFELAQDSLRSR